MSLNSSPNTRQKSTAITHKDMPEDIAAHLAALMASDITKTHAEVSLQIHGGTIRVKTKGRYGS